MGINRDLTVKEFHALRKIGIGGAVIFASGFNEEKDGAALALKLDHAAGEVPYIGPNCYGFANFFDRVALWPDQVTGESLERGVAFISQSGTISITVMGQRRSLPVGYVITVGNQQSRMVKGDDSATGTPGSVGSVEAIPLVTSRVAW